MIAAGRRSNTVWMAAEIRSGATVQSLLVERERKRLGKVEIPEVQELRAYWLGTLPAPPALTVAFSGLGADAQAWVREVGQLAQQVREAAAQDFALTSLVTRESGTLSALD